MERLWTGNVTKDMVKKFSWPALHNIDPEGMWFQEDGATCHILLVRRSRYRARNLRADFFHEVVTRTGPPGSCDLTPLDFFLWGYVNVRVYENKPRTTERLKGEIRRVIGELDTETCQRVITNFFWPELKLASVAEADTCPMLYFIRKSENVYHMFI